MGKLIVIEGLDGCGKSTQLDLLVNNLQHSGTDCKKVSFPNYDSPACNPVKMYLDGLFGTKPTDVNPYAASSFYAVDRYASFKTDWGKYYNNGGTVICGRYVTSNVLHQCSKLEKENWEAFSNWLYDYEYNKMGIPKPDLVIFLSMPAEYSEKLLNSRYGGDENKKDIHETSIEYQRKCMQAALYSAKINGWKTVNCIENGNFRTRESIADEILKIVNEVL